MKILFLIIGTGQYLSLAKNCAKSLQKFVQIPECIVETCIFTNHNEDYHHIDWMPWPLTTLLRYQYYVQYEKEIRKYNPDYIFHIDADALAVNYIGKEILGERVALLHPGQTSLSSYMKTFERNPISKACISDMMYNKYYFGHFDGGTTEEFFKMCHTLNGWIETDLKQNYIPIYHDESMKNRYYKEYPPTVELGYDFCYVDKWFKGTQLEQDKKIICLEKNHDEIRKE